MPRESRFQTELIHDLENMFPGCFVLKNDPNYIQGFPDLLVLYKDKWAALECKRSVREPYQPNQEYYLEVLDDMSFASVICPENRKAVLHELQLALTPRGTTRVSQRL